MKDRYGIVSDLQIPYHLTGFISFLEAIQKEYRIPKENWVCVGDECDAYFASAFLKSPDIRHTAKTELETTKEVFKEWSSKFPLMRLCYSNHGARPFKRASEAGLPSEFIRSWAEVLQTPPGWKWQRNWLVKTRQPFVVEHGHKWNGINGARNAAVNNGISTIIGHSHSFAAIQWVRTEVGGAHFGMNAGSLIDHEALAFDYDRDNKFLPLVGTGVVLDDGARPHWIPCG